MGLNFEVTIIYIFCTSYKMKTLPLAPMPPPELSSIFWRLQFLLYLVQFQIWVIKSYFVPSLFSLLRFGHWKFVFVGNQDLEVFWSLKNMSASPSSCSTNFIFLLLNLTICMDLSWLSTFLQCKVLGLLNISPCSSNFMALRMLFLVTLPDLWFVTWNHICHSLWSASTSFFLVGGGSFHIFCFQQPSNSFSTFLSRLFDFYIAYDQNMISI